MPFFRRKAVQNRYSLPIVGNPERQQTSGLRPFRNGITHQDALSKGLQTVSSYRETRAGLPGVRGTLLSGRLSQEDRVFERTTRLTGVEKGDQREYGLIEGVLAAANRPAPVIWPYLWSESRPPEPTVVHLKPLGTMRLIFGVYNMVIDR